MSGDFKNKNYGKQAVQESDIPAMEEEKEEALLYDYLKEHPSVWISAISGIVVVIGFLFHSMIYGNECKYLQYWHLDEKLIHIQNENQIYELVLSSFLFLGILFISALITNSAERYYKDKRVFFLVNKTYKNIKKEYEKLKKELEAHMTHNEKGENQSDSIKKILELESIVFFYDRSLTNYHQNMEKVQKKIRRNCFLNNLLKFLFIMLCFLCILLVAVAMSSVPINVGDVVVSIVFIVLMWGIIYSIHAIVFRIRTRKQISKMDIAEQYAASEKEFKEFLINKNYLNWKWFDIDLKHSITKEMLQKVFACSLILLVIITGMISGLKKNEIEENKTFNIVDYGNSSYAILYRDDTYFYLEEAEIQGNDIRIYVDNQLRIATEELYSVNMEFDRVIQVTEYNL